MKKVKLTYILIFITICIIIFAVIITRMNYIAKKKYIPAIGNLHYKIVKEIYPSRDENTYVGDSFGTVGTSWDEKTMAERFFIVNYNDINYDSICNKVVSKDMLGEKLITKDLIGYDTNTYEEHNTVITIYSLKNISLKSAIAVQFEENEEYYTYINMLYNTDTFEEFIEDLNLKEYIDFKSISYKLSLEDKSVNFVFKNLDKEGIWQNLLNDSVTPSRSEGNQNSETVMNIKIEVAFVEDDRIKMWLTEEGYVKTNIFYTNRSFYIGKEKLQNFMNHIFDNYEAEATVNYY